jgi:phage-related protein
MTETAIKDADTAFSRQISSQVARITGELNRLEQLLSAGMVDRRVLTEFRDAVNKVRKTSWHVQCWVDGDLDNLASTMIEERIRTASHLASNLASELQTSTAKLSGLRNLKDSIQRLDRVLDESIL